MPFEKQEIDIPDVLPIPVDVRGKRVVITGASRGLGRVIATAFARSGATIGLVARNEERLLRVAADLPGDHLVFSGDVREPDFNEAVADAMVDRCGGLDVWMCNAGISPVLASAQDVDPAVWRRILDTNLTGAFFGARAAARVMRSGGRIIMTGSVIGERAHAGLSAYGVSKGGLNALVRALAVDLGSRNITVNAVLPGWFASPMASAWQRDDDLQNRIIGHTVLGRWGEAADLPGIYLFLASGAAAFVTGTTIPVDGGYLLV